MPGPQIVVGCIAINVGSEAVVCRCKDCRTRVLSLVAETAFRTRTMHLLKRRMEAHPAPNFGDVCQELSNKINAEFGAYRKN